MAEAAAVFEAATDPSDALATAPDAAEATSEGGRSSESSVGKYSCDNLGPEPTIAPVFVTLIATRTAPVRRLPAADGGASPDGSTDASSDDDDTAYEDPPSADVTDAAVADDGATQNGNVPDDSNVADDAGGHDGALAQDASLDGAVPTEALDTAAIQAAIDRCPAGQTVKLVADGDNNSFVSGALFLRTGVTLWIDTGVTLYASHNPRDFDAKPGMCGQNGSGNSSCYALINARSANNTAVVGVGSIDGRGGELVTGKDSSWWALEKAYAGKLAAPRLVQATNVKGFTLYQPTLRNAPKFHVFIEGCDDFRVWGVTINTPADAPNTDGVDPSASTNGVMAYSNITTGDDNVAIKGAGPMVVNHLVFAHNHFGKGHGMSVGSETNVGVVNVEVCDLSLDGTSNGLRIKSDSSRGGPVNHISFTDVCMRRVTSPIVFDPFYSSATGMLIPNFREISVKNVHVLGGGKVTLRGYDAAHTLSATFDNVVFDAPPTIKASLADLTFGPGPVTFLPEGDAVTVAQLPADPAVTPRVCDDAWTTF